MAVTSDIVAKLYQLTNTNQSEEHFSLDSGEQFQTMKAVRDEELKLLAVYHSHPATPARPSERGYSSGLRLKHQLCDRVHSRQ